jgi:uncharacterized phage protein gp47/JayE
MTTNVPIPTFGPNGFAERDASEIFAGVMSDFVQAFGASMNTDPQEPQGQLAVSLTAAIQNFQDLFLLYVNGVDPSYSSGRMQDGIGRLTVGMERIPAQATTVTATCVGAVGTVIQQGALTKTAGGDIYAAVSGGTIPSGGALVLEFANISTGPVACPAHYLNEIYQAIPGWDTVDNAAAGAEGNDQESPTAFEARRQGSVAGNAVGTNDAVRGHLLLTVPGIIDAYVTDNSTDTPSTIGGVLVGANSIFVSVFGGADNAVARAIWEKKNGGCSYTGTTTITVQDSGNGYTVPYPSYQVTFTHATPLPITLAVSMANNSQVPSDAENQLQRAVLAVFSGTDTTGLGRPRIGAYLFGNRFYAAIAALGPWAQIVNIQVGSPNAPDAAAFIGSIGPSSNVLTVTAVSSGVLATGQTVGGALPDTIITGQTGGTTGGVGTYTIGNPQTLASGPLTSYGANAAFSPVHIDQIPVISQGDISVTFL